jgi:Zn-dependent peptidase ImmA (M78 family)
MHEIGHYLLKHYEMSDLAEAEANFFAKFLLAPPILVHLIRPDDYLDIIEPFDISREFAYNAFSYYQKWLYSKRRNNKFEQYELSLFLKYKDASLFKKFV